MKMYVVNQDGTETIELHSVKYKSRWSEKYNKAKNFIWAYPDFFGLNYLTFLMLWKQDFI